jgi:hypothetical protein
MVDYLSDMFSTPILGGPWVRSTMQATRRSIAQGFATSIHPDQLQQKTVQPNSRSRVSQPLLPPETGTVMELAVLLMRGPEDHREGLFPSEKNNVSQDLDHQREILLQEHRGVSFTLQTIF